MSDLLTTTGSGRPPGTKSRRLLTLIQVASLLATAWMVWSVALIPRLRQPTLGTLLWQIFGYTILAWAFSAVVAIGLYCILPLDDRSEMMPQVLRTAATAVWFGPALMLLSQFSPAALLAALVLVVYASRLLYAQWQGPAPPGFGVPARPSSGFESCQLPPSFVWRERLPALAVALSLQAGAIAVAVHYPLVGAAWLCLGTALLTVFSMSMGAADAGRPPTLPRSIVGILATVVLAAMIALGTGAGRGGGSGFGIGSPGGAGKPTLMAAARAVLRELFYGETPEGDAGGTDPKLPRLPSAPDTGAVGGVPGVIITPETKIVTMLVAPPTRGNSMIAGRPAQPLSIPFGGEYWIYRWPFAKPPLGSTMERGNPAKLSFSSTDNRPLEMEAHQKLDTPIDLNCCSKVQVEIANADHYPGTLSLQLVLLNNVPGTWQAPFVLGTAPVRSRPDLSRDPVLAVSETLDFTVPSRPDMQEFNELKIVFQRAIVRKNKSAKVSVERFVLVPR